MTRGWGMKRRREREERREKGEERGEEGERRGERRGGKGTIISQHRFIITISFSLYK